MTAKMMSAENIWPQPALADLQFHKEMRNLEKTGGYSIYINGLEWRQCPRGPHTVTNNNNFFKWRYMEAVYSKKSRGKRKEKSFYSNRAVHLSSTASFCVLLFFYIGIPLVSFSLVIIFLYPLHRMTAWIILLLPPLCNTCGRLPCSLHASTRYTDLYIIIHWALLWANQRSFASIIVLLRPL